MRVTITLVVVLASTVVAAAAASPKHARVLTRSTKLGNVLVDGRGRTLYLFAGDRGAKSTCYAQCAAAWPPYLTTAAPVAGGGAKKALLKTTRRKDGRLQVVYAGHPLYFFGGDRAAGQTRGEELDAFGGEWYAVSAPAAATPPPTTTDPGYGDGGYGGRYGP
jgi:predicted lipoprotein with Yx(FWY)xxD motif